MPCTACGSAQPAKSYQLNKPKKQTNKKVVTLTPQQIAYIRYVKQSRRRTLIFT